MRLRYLLFPAGLAGFGAGWTASWFLRREGRKLIDRVRDSVRDEPFIPTWAVDAERLLQRIERAPPWALLEVLAAIFELRAVVERHTRRRPVA